MKDSQIPTEEWRITSDWIKKMDEVIHDHMHFRLYSKYPDLQIVNDHVFYIDEGRLKIRIYIGVTDNDVETDLELHGATGLVAFPSEVYDEMYHNPAAISNFELAFGDVLDRVVKEDIQWYGKCGIVDEARRYISSLSNSKEVKDE